jgi:hypothetical protein
VQHSTESPEFGDWAECGPLLSAEGLWLQRDTALGRGSRGVGPVGLPNLAAVRAAGRPGERFDGPPRCRAWTASLPRAPTPGEVLGSAAGLCGGPIRSLWVPHLVDWPPDGTAVSSSDSRSLRGYPWANRATPARPRATSPGSSARPLEDVLHRRGRPERWPGLVADSRWTAGLERLRLTAGHRFVTPRAVTVESLEDLGRTCPKLREVWLDCASVAGKFEKLSAARSGRRSKVWPCSTRRPNSSGRWPATAVREPLAPCHLRPARGGGAVGAAAAGARLGLAPRKPQPLGVLWDRRAARAY